MAALLVTQVESSLAAWARPFVSADALVESETQGFAIWRFGHAAIGNVHSGSFLFRFALVLSFSFSFRNFVLLI